MTKQQQTFRRLVSLLLVFLMLMGVFGIMSIHVRSTRTDDWQQRRSALLVDAVNCLKNARHEDGSFGSYTGLVNETAEAAGAVRYAERTAAGTITIPPPAPQPQREIRTC